jgi:hypothetical protein
VAPLLDEAMTRLGKVEQDAVLLRFFSGKSLREIGGALGISEDAAQKRVNRALEKMRGYFMRHGAVVPAAAIIPAVSTHALQAAPAGLASTLISTSLSGGEGTVFGEWDLVWHGASVQTDANGRFIFPRVAAGDLWLTHTVAVQPGDGRQSGHHYVRLAPGSRMQLQLGGVGSTIVGRVERNPGERLTFYGSMWANQTIDVEVLSPQQLVLE